MALSKYVLQFVFIEVILYDEMIVPYLLFE